VAGTLGFCFDTVLSAAGLVISREHRFPYPLNQPWMIALRLNIAATLNVSLEWLKGRCLLAAGCGIMTPFLVWLAKRFQRKGAAVIAF
jgi:hypothetical protein